MIAKTTMFLAAGVVAVCFVGPASAEETVFPDGWESFDVGRLTGLAEGFSGEPAEVQAARAKLAPVFFEKYLADSSKAESIQSGTWTRVVESLAESVSAQTRAEWHRKLLSAFGQRDMKALELVRSVQALDCLGEKDLGLFVADRLAKTSAWQTGSGRDMASLAAALSGGTDIIKAGRSKLASAILTNHLTNAATIRSVQTDRWAGICWTLREDISAEDRAQWAEKLRSAYAQENLPIQEMSSLLSALNGLGDKQLPTFLGTWMADHTDWKSAQVGDLASLARRLSGGTDTVRSARAEMASIVLKKHVTSVSKVHSAGVASMFQLAGALWGDVSPADRAQWAEKVRAAFDPRSMKAKEVSLLRQTLEYLGDREAAVDIARQIEKSESWQSSSSEDLAELASMYVGKTDTASWTIRRKLVSLIARKYLSSPSAVRSVTCQTWAKLASSLAKGLSDEERADWRQKLRAAFREDDLSARELKSLIQASDRLQDRDKYAFAAEWMRENASWRSWEPKDLAMICWPGLMLCRTAGGDGVRRLLLEHLSSKYLSDEAATASMACRDWRTFGRSLMLTLTDADCEGWRRQLRAAFVPTPRAVWAMEASEMAPLAELLHGLGDGHVSRLVSTWIYGSEHWRSMDPDALVSLARRVLVNVPDEEAKAARIRIGEHLAAEYLTDKAT